MMLVMQPPVMCMLLLTVCQGSGFGVCCEVALSAFCRRNGFDTVCMHHAWQVPAGACEGVGFM
jgi:hypothetical protein